VALGNFPIVLASLAITAAAVARRGRQKRRSDADLRGDTPPVRGRME